MVKEKNGIWKVLYHLHIIKGHYQAESKTQNLELDEYIDTLKKSIDRNKTPAFKNIEEKTKSYWKNLIYNSAKELTVTIKKRSTKGQQFSKDLKELEEYQKNIKSDDLDLETLQLIYEVNLKEIRARVKEKLEIEKHNNNRYWIGLIFGFVLGIIASIIAPIIFELIQI